MIDTVTNGLSDCRSAEFCARTSATTSAGNLGEGLFIDGKVLFRATISYESGFRLTKIRLNSAPPNDSHVGCVRRSAGSVVGPICVCLFMVDRLLVHTAVDDEFRREVVFGRPGTSMRGRVGGPPDASRRMLAAVLLSEVGSSRLSIIRD